MEDAQYLLDTCILIDVFGGRRGYQERIGKTGFSRFGTATICVAELYVGAFKKQEEAFFRQIEWVMNNFACYPADPSICTYARLRADLENAGMRLADFDLLIASIAIDNDITLVTRNARHFERIPGLKLEVWE